jgi:hypothetical protein
MVGGWAKEPLVAEKVDVYLLHWDQNAQEFPDVFDTTLKRPADKKEIFKTFPGCIIKYHDTTLTRTQFMREYGELPRSRDQELLKLREALATQYAIDIQMEKKKYVIANHHSFIHSISRGRLERQHHQYLISGAIG